MPADFFNSNSLQIGAKQTQQQHLTMKQRQAIELLSLSRLELENKLTEALLSNPLIEMVETPEDLTSFSEMDRPAAPETEDETAYEAELAENSDKWSDDPEPDGESGEEGEFADDETAYEDDWDDNSSYSSAENESDEREGDDFLAFTPASENSLQEMLQLELQVSCGFSENVREAAEVIIVSLDDDGILRTPLEDIAMSCGCSMEEAEKALGIVQTFDPAGIAARTPAECLLLQLKRNGGWTPLFDRLLNELADDLSRNRPDAAAQKLGVSMDELKNMLGQLSHLNYPPVSGRAAAGNVIIPEVDILPDGAGGFKAVPLKERRTFKLSDDAESASGAGADFLAKVREGKNLLEALEFRKGTILRMAEMLIEVQKDFMESGPEKLHPFTMKQAADYLEFKSESTISRAAAAKYVRTPHGVFPFKYFFTAGYVSSDGDQVSRTADMELLKKLVDEEDKKHPLSDDKLSKLLNEAGHPVARRTVAKYRDIMKIPSSSLRKEHF